MRHLDSHFLLSILPEGKGAYDTRLEYLKAIEFYLMETVQIMEYMDLLDDLESQWDQISTLLSGEAEENLISFILRSKKTLTFLCAFCDELETLIEEEEVMQELIEEEEEAEVREEEEDSPFLIILRWNRWSLFLNLNTLRVQLGSWLLCLLRERVRVEV